VDAIAGIFELVRPVWTGGPDELGRERVDSISHWPHDRGKRLRPTMMLASERVVLDTLAAV
jgi:hypothetical protein